MGTRTYSRRASDGNRKLTALGRARMLAERAAPLATSSLFDVFVPVLGDGTSSNAATEYKKNIQMVYESTPQAVDAYLDTIDGATDEKARTQENALALAAIGMDGTPEQRMRAIRLIDEHLDYSNPAKKTLRLGSMDYLYYQFIAAPNPRGWREQGEDVFIEKFWTRWANYGKIDTSQQGWAQLHSYMAEIGPNKGMPYPNDFYETGRRPVQLNPNIVALLQREYERNQELLEKEGYPAEGMTLYRGTRQPEGLSMESFTSSKSIADYFADVGGSSSSWFAPRGELRTEVVPRKYIMGSYKINRGWDETEVAGKKEYMVLGTSYYANAGITRDTAATSFAHNVTLDAKE